MNPRPPVMTNDQCQPTASTISATMGSERAPPTLAPLSKMLVAKARSRLGNHSETTFELQGYAGASPMPSMRRRPNSDANPRPSAQAAVKKDHQTTAMAYVRRGPSLSTSQPDGIWNAA